VLAQNEPTGFRRQAGMPTDRTAVIPVLLCSQLNIRRRIDRPNRRRQANRAGWCSACTSGDRSTG
jgi:hypothetical protein